MSFMTPTMSQGDQTWVTIEKANCSVFQPLNHTCFLILKYQNEIIG